MREDFFMANEEQNDQKNEEIIIIPPDSQDIVPVEVKEAVAPKGITKKEAQELKERSVALVKQLEDSSGSKELELSDSITTIGVQAQRTASRDLELLRARVGDMISQGGTPEQITQEMTDVRLALNQINPHELSKPNLARQIFGWIPFVGKFSPLKVLEKIAIRYEPVSKQISVIERRLRDGQLMLTRDNVELRKLYEQVESQQLPIQKNAYLGELIMQQLEEYIRRTEDPLKVERARNILHDVSIRVQDLRTMEEVHMQFFVSIEMTRQNNSRLGQAVERTLSLSTNVVTIGLAIQTALSRQKRVMEATQRMREFLGNLVVANAASIKQHTQEIGDVYNSPSIALDKITQAHSDLIDAMDTADRLKQEGIVSARENISKLTELSTDLHQRISGLREKPDEEPKSIEA